MTPIMMPTVACFGRSSQLCMRSDRLPFYSTSSCLSSSTNLVYNLICKRGRPGPARPIVSSSRVINHTDRANLFTSRARGTWIQRLSSIGRLARQCMKQTVIGSWDLETMATQSIDGHYKGIVWIVDAIRHRVGKMNVACRLGPPGGGACVKERVSVAILGHSIRSKDGVKRIP